MCIQQIQSLPGADSRTEGGSPCTYGEEDSWSCRHHWSADREAEAVASSPNPSFNWLYTNMYWLYTSIYNIQVRHINNTSAQIRYSLLSSSTLVA